MAGGDIANSTKQGFSLEHECINNNQHSTAAITHFHWKFLVWVAIRIGWYSRNIAYGIEVFRFQLSLIWTKKDNSKNFGPEVAIRIEQATCLECYEKTDGMAAILLLEWQYSGFNFVKYFESELRRVQIRLAKMSNSEIPSHQTGPLFEAFINTAQQL
eukprot:Gb_00953 [translate_table: standard]